MRRILIAIGIAAGALFLTCAGTRPPRPESTAELAGQDAAREFNAGNFGMALRLYVKALAEARRIDNPALRARYQFNIGRIFYECAFFDSARICFRESARLFVMTGKTEEAAIAGIYEALTYAYTGRADTAASLLMLHGSRVGAGNEGIVATSRTIISLRQGAIETADGSAVRAMQLAREQRDPFLRGGIFYYQAMIAFTRRDREVARQLLDSSLYCYAQSPYRYRNWKTLLGRAIVDYCSGDTITALRYYRRAKMAAPEMILLPAEKMVRECPEIW
ncbi:MAG: hypothetical protein JW863_07935 [Chitinispirillaceae bacterium]|nr:hypothetical protein [Chitinispirillaceae bacterium]